MASFTVSSKIPVSLGNKRAIIGSYVSSGGATGGDIPTGLNTVEAVFLTPDKNAVTNAHVVNETFPLRNVSGTVTIVTGANESGNYLAIGW